MSNFFENRIPSLTGLSLLAIPKHFSPEKIKKKLEKRGVGDAERVIEVALQKFCASRAVPDYFRIQKPLSQRQMERILELFTYLERPYGGAILRTHLIQLKKYLKTSVNDQEKRKQIKKYAEEMLCTALLTARTSTFFLIFNTFFPPSTISPSMNFNFAGPAGWSRIIELAYARGNREVVEFLISQVYPSHKYTSLNLKNLKAHQRMLAIDKAVLFKLCEMAIREGTLSALLPTFETGLPIFFKDPHFLMKLLVCAVENADRDLARLLVEKGAKPEENSPSDQIWFNNIVQALQQQNLGSNESRDVEEVQNNDSLDLDRFVVSGVVDLKALNDSLQGSIISGKKLSFEEREKILRLFFSSEEWKPLIPVRQVEQKRLLTILDSQKGMLSYRNQCLVKFLEKALMTAVGASPEGFRLLLILLVQESSTNKKLLENIEPSIINACALGQKEMVCAYLDIYQPKNLEKYLKQAIEHGHLDIVKILVNAAAPINEVKILGNEEQTVYATIPSAISLAALSGNVEIVEYLLQEATAREIDIHGVRSQGLSPLDYALQEGNSQVIASLSGTPSSGAYIDQCALAIQGGNISLVEKYLHQIDNVNAQTTGGDYLQLVAIQYGRFEILKVLVDEYQADLNGDQLDFKETSLILAAMQKNSEILPLVLSKIDRTIIERDKQEALATAIRNGCLSNVSCLLENGAVVNRKLINQAIRGKNFQIFRLLLAHNQNAISEKDKNDNTLLHTAILKTSKYDIENSASILAYLLVQNATTEGNLLYAQNKEQKNPLQLALEMEFGNTLFIELILQMDPTLKPKDYVHDEKARETAAALIKTFQAEKLNEVD